MLITPLQRTLRRFSAAMLLVIPVIAALAVLIPAVYWWGGVYNVGDNTIVLAETPPREGYAWFGWLVGLPSTLAWLYALYRLWRMFDSLRTELFISDAAARDLRAYSLFTILTVAFDVATSGARRWAMGEFDNAPLYTHININIDHFTLLFTAAIFLIVSMVMVEANRYKAETEQYF